jgi:hypothetical protein
MEKVEVVVGVEGAETRWGASQKRESGVEVVATDDCGGCEFHWLVFSFLHTASNERTVCDTYECTGCVWDTLRCELASSDGPEPCGGVEHIDEGEEEMGVRWEWVFQGQARCRHHTLE